MPDVFTVFLNEDDDDDDDDDTIRNVKRGGGGGGGGEFSACMNFFFTHCLCRIFFRVKPAARIFL